MTTRRGGRRLSRRSRAPAGRTQWEFVTPIAVLATGSQVVTDLTADVIGNNDLPGTLIRFVGSLQMSGATASGVYQLGFGITVMTVDALVAGAVPDPLTDNNQSWYYWNGQRKEALTSAAQGTAPPVAEFDIRSARRIRPGFRLVAIFESGGNPGTINFSLQARLLWRVP